MLKNEKMNESFDVEKSYNKLRGRMLKEGTLVPSERKTTEEYAKLFSRKWITFRKKVFYPTVVLSALILISVSSLTALIIAKGDYDGIILYPNLIQEAIQEADKYLETDYEYYSESPTQIYNVYESTVLCFYEATYQDRSFVVGQLYSSGADFNSFRVELVSDDRCYTLSLEQGNEKNQNIKEILERQVYVHTHTNTLYNVFVSCYVDDVLTSQFNIGF